MTIAAVEKVEGLRNEKPGVSDWFKIVNLIATVGFPFLMMGIGALSAMLIDHDRQLAAIGANRYTVSDAKHDNEQNRAEREKISDRITKQDERIHALQLELRDGQFKILEEIQSLKQ